MSNELILLLFIIPSIIIDILYIKQNKYIDDLEERNKILDNNYNQCLKALAEYDPSLHSYLQKKQK